MSSEIIVACVSGVFTILTVMITNMQSNKKIEHSLDKQQAITDTKIDELTREVREHNNFAKRMPVVEEKLSNLEYRLTKLEK